MISHHILKLAPSMPSDEAMHLNQLCMVRMDEVVHLCNFHGLLIDRLVFLLVTQAL